MLHVTPQARAELHGLLVRALDQRQTPQQQPQSRPQSETQTQAQTETEMDAMGLRLVPSAQQQGSSQLALTLDEPRDGDEVVEHDGRSVLILDSSTASLVDNLTLDVVETPQGARLGFRE